VEMAALTRYNLMHMESLLEHNILACIGVYSGLQQYAEKHKGA